MTLHVFTPFYLSCYFYTVNLLTISNDEGPRLNFQAYFPVLKVNNLMQFSSSLLLIKLILSSKCVLSLSLVKTAVSEDRAAGRRLNLLRIEWMDTTVGLLTSCFWCVTVYTVCWIMGRIIMQLRRLVLSGMVLCMKRLSKLLRTHRWFHIEERLTYHSTPKKPFR